jgi:hypothetical protein
MTNGYGKGHGTPQKPAAEKPKPVENEKRTAKPEHGNDAAGKR